MQIGILTQVQQWQMVWNHTIGGSNATYGRELFQVRRYLSSNRIQKGLHIGRTREEDSDAYIFWDRFHAWQEMF
jgi:hypothetical protein